MDMEATVPSCSAPKYVLRRVTWDSQVPYHGHTHDWLSPKDEERLQFCGQFLRHTLTQ